MGFADATPSGYPARHLGAVGSDRQHMLDVVGVATLEELADRALPPQIRLGRSLDLPPAVGESAHETRMRELAAMNHPLRSMIGLGYYGTITPAVIRRNVLENPSWYTAYTPYQPEISQGRLEALLDFQTMVSDLTGLPVANASLLDEATAVAEAMAVARRTSRKGECLIVDPGILPQTLAVVRTRAQAVGVDVVVAAPDIVSTIRAEDPFGVVVQVPAADGTLRSPAELRAIADAAHERKATVVAAADLLALTLIEAPGEWGADVAVGTTQRFGVPLFFGGPHAAYMSVRHGLERTLPGRVVGQSVDRLGHPALRLALQTREQHIRREKATSNICTAQVLPAIVAAMYAVYHGPGGLRAIAEGVHQKARFLAGALVAGGLRLAGESFFDTVTAEVADARAVVRAAHERGVHLRLVDERHVGVSVGEDTLPDDLDAVLHAFGVEPATPVGDLAGHERGLDYLTDPVFHSHRSETRMMRYLRTLADRDYALDRGMIPLGSCTMKLNAASAMEPISLPGFADLHPFVPPEDAAGYAILTHELEAWLAEISGYDAVTLQPNAGSQGEFTGLLAIRSYHRAHGHPERTVCLIPSSAHGTNAASAVLAGMKVVVVRSADDGTISHDDLREKLAQHEGLVGACMVTYPSTHGEFEDTITSVCDLVHAAGGQVYIDGANMNALMGLARPGDMGGDVSHFNLHKTFAIPHGGGGPGVGPVGAKAHLAPYLPGHPGGPGPVAAAQWGSAGVLPISHGFIAMMGADGLRQATLGAILGANYIAARLRDHFPILYTGRDGLVAHECILDLRPVTKQAGLSVDDVAKRLIDYGFHAPTMSFPVVGTLMVEPTESEDLGELDRFCDAMIAIHAEIVAVGEGRWPQDDNPLTMSPHTADEVCGDEWPHAYPRSTAAFPTGHSAGLVGAGGHDKYWPPVARLDNAYGDRHLVCTCPPIDAYE